MLSKVKIGVVGAGVFGGHHAAKFSESENAELACVFDIVPERASALAARYGAVAAMSLDALIERVDAVVIAAPASEHFELAKRALQAKRHVFVEKPLAPTAEQARLLTELADRCGVILQVGHQERYVCESVGLLPTHATPLRIDCVRAVPTCGRSTDVSAIFDLMIHDIDIVRQITDADIASVSASGGYDRVETELLLTNGMIVGLVCDRCSGQSERTIELTFEDGVQKFDFIKREFVTLTVNGVAPENVVSDPLRFGDCLFVDAILNGERPVISGAQSLGNVEWAERIQTSVGIGYIDSQETPLEAARA